jgi:hypothetical protein
MTFHEMMLYKVNSVVTTANGYKFHQRDSFSQYVPEATVPSAGEQITRSREPNALNGPEQADSCNGS